MHKYNMYTNESNLPKTKDNLTPKDGHPNNIPQKDKSPGKYG